MNDIIQFLLGNPLLLVLAVVGIGLCVDFMGRYLYRGYKLRNELAQLKESIEQITNRSPGDLKQQLAAIFSTSNSKLAWNEFEETLHEQHAYKSGERYTSAIRATVPAEAFFSVESVVDGHIGAEYFKHLPGILTGLGIIGTFFGLIQGLTGFDPSIADSVEVKRGLHQLFGHVHHAFVFSGVAIFLAITITLIEKLLYSSLTNKVSDLAMTLDGLFRAGVGEEYLSSLLQSSQDGATQVRQLKEAMVEDLKTLLTNLTDRQILATQQLSTDLGQKIHESLKGPLDEIARTVRETNSRQTEDAGAVMKDLMVSFMAQMRESMGGQMGDLSNLLQQTATAMGRVEAAMSGLVHDMRRAGEESTSGTQAAIRQLMQQLQEHQNAQNSAVSETTRGVFNQLQEAVAKMAVAQEEAARIGRESNEDAAQKMQGYIKLMAKASVDSVDSSKELVDKIGAVSNEMIERLSTGAATVASVVEGLQGAIERLSRLTNELAGLEGQTRQSSQDIAQASSQLAASSQAVGGALTQLGVSTLRLESVSKSFASEAEARQQLLLRLQEVFKQSKDAGDQFAELSVQVRESLEENISQFGSGVGKVLADHLNMYQKQLGDAVQMLQGALEELAEYAAADKG